jgi:DNA repair protein RadD
MPKSVLEFLERQSELTDTEEISVVPNKQNPKYWTVNDYRAGTTRTRADNDNERQADNDNYSPGMREILDDDIPF